MAAPAIWKTQWSSPQSLWASNCPQTRTVEGGLGSELDLHTTHGKEKGWSLWPSQAQAWLLWPMRLVHVHEYSIFNNYSSKSIKWIFCIPPSVVQGNSGILLSSVLWLFQSFGQLKLHQKKQKDRVGSKFPKVASLQNLFLIIARPFISRQFLEEIFPKLPGRVSRKSENRWISNI